MNVHGGSNSQALILHHGNIDNKFPINNIRLWNTLVYNCSNKGGAGIIK